MSWNSRYTNEKTAGDPSFWHQLGEVLTPLHKVREHGSDAGRQLAEDAVTKFYEQRGIPAGGTGVGGVPVHELATRAGEDYDKANPEHIDVASSLTSTGVDSALGYGAYRIYRGIGKGIKKVERILNGKE